MFAVGTLLICGSLLGAVLAYQAYLGELFSPVNHSLSELGTYGSSSLAVVANGGLFFGGLLLSLSCLQGLRSVPGFGVAIWLLLAAAWLLLAIVGLFPSNVYHLHTAALQWYFYFALASSMGYWLWLALRPTKPQSKSALAFCSITVLFVSAFLVLPHLALETLPFNRAFYEEIYPPFPRPGLWWPAVLEWGSLISMLLWQAELLRCPD